MIRVEYAELGGLLDRLEPAVLDMPAQKNEVEADAALAAAADRAEVRTAGPMDGPVR